MASQTPQNSKRSTDLKLANEVVKNTLERHQAVTLTALDVVPRQQRINVYVLWTISLLALVMGPLLIVNTHEFLGFLSLVATLATIISSFVILRHPVETTVAEIERSARKMGPTPAWSRVVPQIPIKEDTLKRLNVPLTNLRSKALVKILQFRKEKENPIEDRQVRINVFLASTERVKKYGEVCGLFISKFLHDKMEGHKDRDVTFRPHEGLSGRTFTLGEACGARAKPNVDGELEWRPVPVFTHKVREEDWREFSLSKEQVTQINSKLRWIVSFPLQSEAGEPDKTIGVLNVDGLEHDLDDKEMNELALTLDESVKDFARQLSQVPMCRVTIQVEDLPSTDALL